MQTHFTAEQLTNPNIISANKELTACLQCGYCLSNCPTYQIFNDELDSPRGRVYQIKTMLEENKPPDAKTVQHIDRCLSCLACMSSCPSFVNYMHLIDHAREYVEQRYRRPVFERLSRNMLASILPYPRRFRTMLRVAKWIKPIGFMFSRNINAMLSLVPKKLPKPSASNKPNVFPAIGQRQRRVALLTGCAQQVLNTDINQATIRILRRHGCEVVVAKGGGCCGALLHHMGKTYQSHHLASQNIRAWMKEVNGEGLDAIVVNTSGCGTVVKDYGHLFRDTALAQQAETVASLAKDISELLSELTLDYKIKPRLRIAYHATCSLQYGQRIRFLPKKLLKAAGFTVLEPKDSHTCCGSAGTYSLLQPEVSQQLKQYKVQTLAASRPEVIAAGNIGCMVQISSGTQIPVVHTVELLDWVTGGPVPSALASLTQIKHILRVV